MWLGDNLPLKVTLLHWPQLNPGLQVNSWKLDLNSWLSRAFPDGKLHWKKLQVWGFCHPTTASPSNPKAFSHLTPDPSIWRWHMWHVVYCHILAGGLEDTAEASRKVCVRVLCWGKVEELLGDGGFPNSPTVKSCVYIWYHCTTVKTTAPRSHRFLSYVKWSRTSPLATLSLRTH